MEERLQASLATYFSSETSTPLPLLSDAVRKPHRKTPPARLVTVQPPTSPALLDAIASRWASLCDHTSLATTGPQQTDDSQAELLLVANSSSPEASKHPECRQQPTERQETPSRRVAAMGTARRRR